MRIIELGINMIARAIRIKMTVTLLKLICKVFTNFHFFGFDFSLLHNEREDKVRSVWDQEKHYVSELMWPKCINKWMDELVNERVVSLA